MPKVKNEHHAGSRIAVLDQVIELDAVGVAEVSAELAAFLKAIPGFVVEEAPEQAAEDKAPAKKAAPKKSAAADKE